MFLHPAHLFDYQCTLFFLGEKLVVLKSRLQQAMAIRRKEERERRAALHRLDNEDCEEEEAEMTESEDEEVSEISISYL